MKYALVHNNAIKVGPRDYHKGFFDDYLKDNNLPTTNVPWQYDGLEPIQIDTDVHIVPVEEPAIPNHNPVTEQLDGPYWNDLYSWPIKGVFFVADVRHDAAQNKLKEIVAGHRYTKENVILKTQVQSQNVVVSTARSERAVWQEKVTSMNTGDTINFKFNNGVWLTLTKSDVQNVHNLIVSTVQAAFDWEKNKVDLIDAATDKASLEAIYDDINQEMNPPRNTL